MGAAYLKKAKRVVIKVGSALVVDQKTGRLKARWLNGLAKDIAMLQRQGKEVVVVTSGAVALGRKLISSREKLDKLEEKQAAAACGQIELMRYFQKYLGENKIRSAQILMTVFDSENRRHYLNIRNTVETLLARKVVPVINENDTVATQELRFGDNDRLAARVGLMISSELLVLLTDIDGLYTANPRLDKSAKKLEEITEITTDIVAMAGQSLSNVGTGGMITKVEAAKIAVKGGCHMVITKGDVQRPIQSYLKHNKGTIFISNETPLSARKQWIASSLHIRGHIVVDQGAVKALKKGSSLLPAGVVDVTGEFDRGDTVAIQNCRGQEIGRGLLTYDANEARLIMGQKSREIANIVGFSGRDELIHTDDLVLI